MKTAILAASLLALSTTALASDVGVSINVGQPGFYGRLDIGNFPPPPVIYQQPIIVERPVQYVPVAPLYLRVPPGHAKHWARHCREYNACGHQVYFVQDGWYQNEYVPRYRERHGEFRREHDVRDRDRERGRDQEHGRDHDRGHGEHGERGEHGHHGD